MHPVETCIISSEIYKKGLEGYITPQSNGIETEYCQVAKSHVTNTGLRTIYDAQQTY